MATFLGRMVRDRDGGVAENAARADARPVIFSSAPCMSDTLGTPDTPNHTPNDVPSDVPDEADAATPRAWAAALGGPVAEADISFLAAGEYHENWLIRAPAGPVVLRSNRGGAAGSQLGLADQISYEYRALRALAACGATPRPLALAPLPDLPDLPDLSDRQARGADAPVAASSPGGALLMQWLPGRALDYRTDASHAARVFAAVHAAPVPPAVELPPPGQVPHALPRGMLAAQPDPVGAIVAESSALLDRHVGHPLAPRMIHARHALLGYRDRVARLAGDTRHLFADEAPVIANTEVNSGNFLVPEGDGAASSGNFAAPCGAWLVDWEKAVVTTRYQDLGHFLSPTTTLWKADHVFDAASRAAFLDAYRAALRAAGHPAPDAEECAVKTDILVRAVLLRGLSWCLMAWHEYAGGGRALAHADTFRTIERYLGNIAWFLR
nr:hypothetical protein RVX_2638 [Nitratidesulfovibrio sp. HK-II]